MTEYNVISVPTPVCQGCMFFKRTDRWESECVATSEHPKCTTPEGEYFIIQPKEDNVSNQD